MLAQVQPTCIWIRTNDERVEASRRRFEHCSWSVILTRVKKKEDGAFRRAFNSFRYRWNTYERAREKKKGERGLVFNAISSTPFRAEFARGVFNAPLHDRYLLFKNISRGTGDRILDIGLTRQ